MCFGAGKKTVVLSFLWSSSGSWLVSHSLGNHSLLNIVGETGCVDCRPTTAAWASTLGIIQTSTTQHKPKCKQRGVVDAPTDSIYSSRFETWMFHWSTSQVGLLSVTSQDDTVDMMRIYIISFNLILTYQVLVSFHLKLTLFVNWKGD